MHPLFFSFNFRLSSFLLLSAIFNFFFSIVFFMVHFSYWISFYHSCSIFQIIIFSIFYLICSFLTKCKTFLFLFFYFTKHLHQHLIIFCLLPIIAIFLLLLFVFPYFFVSIFYAVDCRVFGFFLEFSTTNLL